MITKEQFDKLFSDTITHKEYSQTISVIDKRFQQIVKLVFPSIMKGNNWFDYENVDYRGEKDGYFDPDRYEEFIMIGGKNSFPDPYCWSDHGNGCFPTRWLWTKDEDIVAEYKAEIKKAKQEAEVKAKKLEGNQAKLKEGRKKLVNSIRSKLTPEELKMVKFKK